MAPHRTSILRFSLFLALFVFLGAGVQPGPLWAMPPVQRTVLPNRLVLLVSEDHSLPIVTFQLLVDAGSWRDPHGREGLAYLTAKGLLLGTAGHSVTALREDLDFMGASLEADAGKDYATLELRVLKKDLDKGFALFLEALTAPTFPEKEIRRRAARTLAAIQSEEDEPGRVAEKGFQKALFLSSPYGHPVEGTRESVPGLTRGEVTRFYRNFYRPNVSILAIVGDVTPAEVRTRIVPRLAAWRPGEVPPTPFDSAFARGPETIKIDRPLTQANVILGNAGISRGNPDYYAVTVMNYILGGGGFASRLMREIRTRRGLAYSVASVFEPGRHPGSFQVVFQTKSSSTREAISIARGELEHIRREPVSEPELEAAKRYLVGSFPLRFATHRRLASFLTQAEYYGLGPDYPAQYPDLIRKVTREDVLRVARAYLHPDKLILVVVGNLKEAGLQQP